MNQATNNTTWQPEDGWLSGLSEELQAEIISDSQPRHYIHRVDDAGYTPWQPQEFDQLPPVRTKSQEWQQGAVFDRVDPSISQAPSRPLTVTPATQESFLRIDAIPLLQVAERMTMLSKLIVQNCNQGIWPPSVQQAVGYLSAIQNELYNAIQGRK